MNEPTTRTLGFCRSLTADGELSAEELWLLADWLNANPDCCDHWPGNELAVLLSAAFENGSVTMTELKKAVTKLSAIERKAAKLRDAEMKALREVAIIETIESYNPAECSLPYVDATVSVGSKSSIGVSYSVDLRTASCDCPDWVGSRRQTPKLSLARCCKHVAEGLQQFAGKQRWPDWLGALIANCVERGGGTNPTDSWRTIQIKEGVALFSIGHGDWCNVFAPLDRYHSRYGYNPSQRRWSYGVLPDSSAAIARAIQSCR